MASLEVQTRFLPSTKPVLFTERVLRPPDPAKFEGNSSKSLKLSKVHIHRYTVWCHHPDLLGKLKITIATPG